MLGTFREGVHTPAVRLFFRDGQVAELVPESEPAIVPAGDLILAVNSVPARRVELDGTILSPAMSASQIVVPLDLTRSTGYHIVTVGERSYSFATEDAKLRIEGISRIATALLASSVVGWDRQILFADGGLLDVPETRFAWLWRNIPQMATVIEAIGRSPKMQSIRRSEMTSALYGRLDVGATLRAIRRNPDLLEERTLGAVSLADGRAFTPSRVAIRRRNRSLLTPPNFQAYLLARIVLAMVHELRDTVPPERLSVINPAVARIERSLSLPLYQLLSRSPVVRSSVITPSTASLSDYRYAFVAAKYAEILNRGWDSSAQSTGKMLAFIKYADEIYQAFVAVTLAQALGCELRNPDIQPRLNVPLFASDDIDLYYDTSPPARILQTWRQQTDQPDEPRPDILLYDTKRQLVLMADAKYRHSGNRASKDSLYEMQYYLNTFQLTHAVVCYPPVDTDYKRINMLRGSDFAIAEVPIAPAPDLATFARDVAAPLLRDLLETVRF